MLAASCSGGGGGSNGGGSAPSIVPCPRFGQGSTVTQPEDLFSTGGVLKVNLSYQTTVDEKGNTRFCYMLADGTQAPTLHINPGDHLVLTLTNLTPKPAASSSMRMEMSSADSSSVCGDAVMDASSTNVHFHGTNTPPTCHADEVIHTLINSGETFTYDVPFPADEPPGLYWYHPHVHGVSDAAVLGGASGAIVVEGIQNLQPAVDGLPAKILIIRDNPVPGLPSGSNVPAWDLSLNYIPVPYPNYPPAVITMAPGERQFWRVLNASADTIVDLQLLYDGVPQPLQIVALDGVPTGSQDGTGKGTIVTVDHILVPTAGRAELIVTGPDSSVKNATLMTLKVDTGPWGDNDPARPLATIHTVAVATEHVRVTMPAVSGRPNPQRFAGLAEATPSVTRRLFFSEIPGDTDDTTRFFITVDGQTPVLFSPNNPPAIVTTQGTTEDWTVFNRSFENHEFHIHQIHFLLLERDGVPVPPQDQQMLDTVDIPHWTGAGPYPSVTLRMDFRGPTVGDFVYHCHILAHEDHGMMAIIRVLPQSSASAARSR